MRWILVPVAALLVHAACSGDDGRGSYSFQYQKMQFVSGFPAKKVQGEYVPACDPGDAPEAVIFSFNLVGTLLGLAGTTGSDRDLSIRPGDLLRKGSNPPGLVPDGGPEFGPGNFVADLACAEPYPDPFLAGGSDTCRGLSDLVPVPKRLSYQSFFKEASLDARRPAAGDHDMLSVAVLLDQSGSMKGYVNRDTRRETKENSFEVYPQEFAGAGTDPKGYRLTAVRALLARLDDTDRAGVFFFDELGGTQVACDAPVPVGRGRSCDNATPCPDGTTCIPRDGNGEGTCEYTFTNKARDCFSAAKKRTYIDPSTQKEKEVVDRYSITGANTFMDLVATPSGRTRLWQSVLDAYLFLRDSERTPVRHLIVVTDGPETCFAGNPATGHPAAPDFEATQLYTDRATGKKVAWPQSAPCASKGFEDFLEVLQSDLADESAPRVHVSFLQMQAFGYPDRDPLQQEIACRTGGQYLFVNSNEFEKDKSPDHQGLEAAMKDAMERLRYTLAGSWNLTVELPALTDPRFAGAEVAIEGTLQMKESTLMPQDTMTLAVGREGQALAIPNHDQRAAVRVPCTGDDACAPSGSECRKSFCGAAGTCAPETLPGALNTQACGGGTCCWGACVSCAGTLDDFCNCKPGP